MKTTKKAPFCWLLLLAVISDIQISNGGVISHQRDLLWAEDKSVEVSKIEKRHDLHSPSNATEDALQTVENNNTLSANETQNIDPHANQAAEVTTKEPTNNNQTTNKTEGLNVNTAKIDEKVVETSQVETERKIRSNGYKKQCESQLLSYNPLSFTPHEFGQDYNPPPPKHQPSAYNKPITRGNQNYNNLRPLSLPSYNQQESAKDNKYPVAVKTQSQYYENRDSSYNNGNAVKYATQPHLLCKGGYSYNDKEGVCILTQPRPQIPGSKSYPVASPYPMAGTNKFQQRVSTVPSNAKEITRPELKQYGLLHRSHSVYNNEQKIQYHEKPSEGNGAEKHKIILRPYAENSPPSKIEENLPKPQYPKIADKPYNIPRPLSYHPQNNRGDPPYSPGVLQSNQGKPKPYVQNTPKKRYSYAPVTQAPQYEKKETPAESYETENNYEQPDGYSKANYKPSSYKTENINYAKPQKKTQYNVERKTPPSVGYTDEEQYPSKEENSPSAYSNGYGQEDADSSDDKYDSDEENSSSEKEFIPITQYLAEKESSYTSEQDSDDSSEDASYSKEYDSAYPEIKSSKYSEKQRKSSKNSLSGKSKYINPYVSLYTSEDSNEHRSHGRKNLKYSSGESKYHSHYESTYDDENYGSCKKPKALKEIILPKGGFLLEGEYVLKRKGGSQKGVNEDYDKHKHCPNYPRIIDRITIGKGGYIHKGKYTLDKGHLEYYTDESDSNDDNNERTKKEIDHKTDDEEDIEISIPYKIEDDNDDDGVHISVPREIDNEMFEGEELEEKKLEKRQLPKPRLPTIILPVDLNLVDPMLKSVAKIKNDVNQLRLKIRKKEIQREVDRAIKNLQHLGKDNKEKMDRFASDLKNKLEIKNAQTTPLVNRNNGNRERTLSTTINFNSPSLGSPLGSPILRNLRALNPILPANPLERALFPARFSTRDSDKDDDPVLVRRQSTKPRAFEDDEKEPPFLRKRLLQPNVARCQNKDDDDDDDQPQRFNLLEPEIPVKVKKYRYRSGPTRLAESRNKPRRLEENDHDDYGRMNEVTEYEMSLLPLVRKGIHAVQSLVFDGPESYPPTRRLRSPRTYKRQTPQKVSRAVFNEDGYWYEKDFTDIARVKRPREVIYRDVVYDVEPEYGRYPYYSKY